jgi:uncharacterized membrane protein YjdF
MARTNGPYNYGFFNQFDIIPDYFYGSYSFIICHTVLVEAHCSLRMAGLSPCNVVGCVCDMRM